MSTYKQIKIIFLAAALLSLYLFSFALADTISLPLPEYKAVFSWDKEGEHITVDGFTVIGSPGDPALPFKELSIIIPR